MIANVGSQQLVRNSRFIHHLPPAFQSQYCHLHPAILVCLHRDDSRSLFAERPGIRLRARYALRHRTAVLPIPLKASGNHLQFRQPAGAVAASRPLI